MKQYIVKVVTEGDDGQVWEFLVRNSYNLQQKRNSDCGFFGQYEPDLIDKDVTKLSYAKMTFKSLADRIVAKFNAYTLDPKLDSGLVSIKASLIEVSFEGF